MLFTCCFIRPQAMPWRCAIGFLSETVAPIWWANMPKPELSIGLKIHMRKWSAPTCYHLQPLDIAPTCTQLLPLATAFCGLWKMHWGLPKSEMCIFGCGCIYGHQEMHKRMLQSVPCLFSLPISLFVAFWYVWLAQFVFHVFGYLDAIFLVLKNA